MAYTKTNWVNGGPPAIDADNLNKIEAGIYDTSVDVDAIKASLTSPVMVRGFTTPSRSYNPGNTWVYNSDWRAEVVPGYTPIGVLQATPNSGGQGLISQLIINYASYGNRFAGNVTNTTSSAITGTIQVPVLYVRNELL